MIDPTQLAKWANERSDAMKSPVAKAIYAGLAARALRPDGFDTKEAKGE